MSPLRVSVARGPRVEARSPHLLRGADRRPAQAAAGGRARPRGPRSLSRPVRHAHGRGCLRRRGAERSAQRLPPDRFDGQAARRSADPPVGVPERRQARARAGAGGSPRQHRSDHVPEPREPERRGRRLHTRDGDRGRPHPPRRRHRGRRPTRGGGRAPQARGPADLRVGSQHDRPRQGPHLARRLHGRARAGRDQQDVPRPRGPREALDRRRRVVRDRRRLPVAAGDGPRDRGDRFLLQPARRHP